MSEIFDLTGKVALVTGSGSGIGRAISHLFAVKGADVVVNDVSVEDAAGTLAEIERLGAGRTGRCAERDRIGR